jgi:hypothetical protein
VLFPLRALVVSLNLDPYVNVGVQAAPVSVHDLALATAGFGFVGAGLVYNSKLPARLGSNVKLPSVGILNSPPAWLAWLMLGAGYAGTALVVRANETSASVLTGNGTLASAASATSAYMIAGLCLLTRRAARHSWGTWVQLLIAVFAALALAFWGQFKEPAIIALLSVLVAWRYTHRSISLRRCLAVVLVVVFVVFPVVDASRLASDRLGTRNPVTVLGALPDQLSHYSLRGGAPRPLRPWTPLTDPLIAVTARLYSYDTMVLSVWYTPSVVPYQHGRTLALVAAGLVPRAVWPQKPPVGLGTWWTEHYWNTPFGQALVPQAIGHPAELWIDFGFPGVIIGLAVLAFIYRAAFVAFDPERSAVGMMAYAIMFVTALDVDRDLPLVYVTLAQRFVALAVPVTLLWLIERLRQRRSELHMTV